jgi:hypothetical protein
LLAFLRTVIQREANYADQFRCRQAAFLKKIESEPREGRLQPTDDSQRIVALIAAARMS